MLDIHTGNLVELHHGKRRTIDGNNCPSFASLDLLLVSTLAPLNPDIMKNHEQTKPSSSMWFPTSSSQTACHLVTTRMSNSWPDNSFSFWPNGGRNSLADLCPGELLFSLLTNTPKRGDEGVHGRCVYQIHKNLKGPWSVYGSIANKFAEFCNKMGTC